MKIQVIGSGCSTCKKLYELTQEAVTQLRLHEKVEYITDVSEIIAMGVLSTPVLAVNNKPVIVGSVPDIERIKSVLTIGADTADEKESKCSCGGDCC